MSEPKILFDVLDQSAGPSVLFSFPYFMGFPSLLLFFAVRGFRKARTKLGKIMGFALGAVALFLMVAGMGALFTNPLATEYRKYIESHDYTEVRGEITHLTESTLVAGNPAATFEVAGHVFAYGRGSENYQLEMVDKGGILTNGLPVKIWLKDDKILRIFSVAEESKLKGGEHRTR